MKELELTRFEQELKGGNVDHANVTLVGGSPAFRDRVARALQRTSEDIDWAEDVHAAQVLLSGKKGTACVLVLSPEVAEMDALGLAETITRQAPTTAVVLVRERELNGLLPTAMRAGIRDFVDLSSAGPNDLKEALERAMSWTLSLSQHKDRKGTQSGQIIVVFSSKGGVGKTFVATNLAAALATRSGKETAVIDLDMGMGDVFSYYGTEPARPLHDIIGLDGDRDGEHIMSAATSLSANLHGYASPNDLTQEETSGDEIGKMLRALQRNFAFVVVDTPADYSDQVLSAFDAADEICLVAGLDVVGVKHLSKAIETLLSIGIDENKLRVVLNRADSKVGLDPDDVQRIMNIKIESMIPSSRLVPTSLNKGRLLYQDDPKADVSKAIGDLADEFIVKPQPGKAAPKRRFFKKGQV
jgi:pilus assembly protein CpaE